MEKMVLRGLKTQQQQMKRGPGEQKVLERRDACGGGGTADIDDLCSLADGSKEEVLRAGCVSAVGPRGCGAGWLEPACWSGAGAPRWCRLKWFVSSQIDRGT